MTTTKRLYFYGVAFAALLVVAFGAVLLFNYLLDTVLGRLIIGGGRTQASVGIAMVVVGGPLWLVHWNLAWRQLEAHPEEAESPLRKLYAYAVLLLAAIIVLNAARSLLGWALRTEDFSTSSLSQTVVWGGVWAFHWAQERREGQPSPGARTLRRWYLYIVSVYALILLATGVNGVLNVLFLRVYDGLIEGAGSLLPGPSLWSEGMRESLASTLLGGAWWVLHWRFFAHGDRESTLRQVYLYLFAFLIGAIATLAAVAVIVFTGMQWLLSVPDLETATQHFRVIPTAMAAFLVGAAMLGYHRAVVQEESTLLGVRLPSARRTLGYVISALGLATLTGSVIFLLGGLTDFAFPTAGTLLKEPDSWRTFLALALTLQLIGAPLWFISWSRVQRRLDRDGAEERTTLSRRIYLYGALGVLALVALSGLVGLLSILLDDLLSARLSLDVLREGNWFLSIALTAGAFLAYHWQVLREDQRAGGETVRRRKQVILVIGEGLDDTVSRLESALGTGVRVLRVVSTADQVLQALTDDEIEELATGVQNASTERVLVVVDEGRPRIYPYH